MLDVIDHLAVDEVEIFGGRSCSLFHDRVSDGRIEGQLVRERE
jgi:hypothetical protein